MEEIYEQIELISDNSDEGEKNTEKSLDNSDAGAENAEKVAESAENVPPFTDKSGESAENGTEAAEEKSCSAEEGHEGTEEKSESAEENAQSEPNGEKKKTARRRTAKDVGEQSDGTEAAIAPEKMSKAEAMRVLEAIMFANGDEVYYDQFAKIIGYTTKEAIKIVDAYAKMYDSGSMPRGIRLVKYDKCCQLTTAPDLGEYVTQMIGIRGEPQLSAAAMETLAIVAYNQPVTRAYIEQVRRVDSTRPIAVLLDRELIEEKGRLEVIGRPRLFGTTQNFLKTFGITSLDALPSLDLFAVEN